MPPKQQDTRRISATHHPTRPGLKASVRGPLRRWVDERLETPRETVDPSELAPLPGQDWLQGRSAGLPPCTTLRLCSLTPSALRPLLPLPLSSTSPTGPGHPDDTSPSQSNPPCPPNVAPPLNKRRSCHNLGPPLMRHGSNISQGLRVCFERSAPQFLAAGHTPSFLKGIPLQKARRRHSKREHRASTTPAATARIPRHPGPITSLRLGF